MSGILEVFEGVLRKLEGAGLGHMVVGSVASIVYGEARMTRDMDVVVDLRPEDVRRFEKLFSGGEFYCPPAEVLRQEVVERGQFNLVHEASGLKIDIMVRKDTEHGREEFARRVKVPFWEGFEAYLARPEDVILKKLVYFREGGSQKHAQDIRGMLAETEVDRAYLDRWLDRLGLREVWNSVA